MLFLKLKLKVMFSIEIEHWGICRNNGNSTTSLGEICIGRSYHISILEIKENYQVYLRKNCDVFIFCTVMILEI